jgi:hypothetical protein
MTAIGNAVAGVKVKCRNVWYLTKWEQVEADYQQGHMVSIYEHKRILSRTDGKTFVLWECGLLDRKPTGGTRRHTGACELRDSLLVPGRRRPLM